MVYVLGGLIVVSVVQSLLLWRVISRVGGMTRVQDRLSHFAEALALLTDTTEAGLANIAGELSQPGRRRSPRASAKNPTTKRIATAARRGESLEDIAAAEHLSQSEIRLHLDLGKGEDRLETAINGALRG